MKGIVSVFLILMPTVLFGVMGNTTQMIIALFAGFISVIVLNFDKIDSFKAGQIEAKMRHVDEVIEEASATIDQLKKVSEPLMDYTLAHIAKGNSVVGVGGYHKETLYKRVNENISEFNIEDDYTKRLLTQAKDDIRKTYFDEILIYVEDSKDWSATDSVRDLTGENPKEINILKDFLKKNKLHDNEVQKRIDEYERFIDENYT